MEMHLHGRGDTEVPIVIFRNSRRKRETAAPSARFPKRLSLESLEERALMDAGLAPQLLLTLTSGDHRTVRLNSPVEVGSALTAYQTDPDVRAAEVDQQVSVSLLPNDPQMGSLWDLRNTGQVGGTVSSVMQKKSSVRSFGPLTVW